MSTLYFEDSTDADQVGVVKSNETIKFSGGFSKFMKRNHIVKGERLEFTLVADKTFLVVKL